MHELALMALKSKRCYSCSNPFFLGRSASSTRHGYNHIPVGRSMKSILGDLYELHGISHQQAASQGLQDYVRKIIQEEAQLNEIFAEGLEVAAARL